MSELAVDPALLRTTARRLHAAVEVARDVRSEGSTLAVLAGDAGHEGLRDAVDTFVSRWSHGIGCLVEDAQTLAALLDRAGTAYGAVEDAVARACGPGG
jgi:hypothetical protein